jgi:hypothetical protein
VAARLLAERGRDERAMLGWGPMVRRVRTLGVAKAALVVRAQWQGRRSQARRRQHCTGVHRRAAQQA